MPSAPVTTAMPKMTMSTATASVDGDMTEPIIGGTARLPTPGVPSGDAAMAPGGPALLPTHAATRRVGGRRADRVIAGDAGALDSGKAGNRSAKTPLHRPQASHP